MRRALAPYAISAALVFILSIAALGLALAAGGLLDTAVVVEPTPAIQATRAPIELSRNGHIAYWRRDGAGATLWVANLDGSQRRSLATIDQLSRVGATRWAPDGTAVAYLDRRQGAVIVRLDGSRTDIPLAAGTTQSAGPLSDLEWSTDGRSIASTQRSGTGSGDADVYVASASGGGWRRITAATGGFLSQWISADELLIHTQQGLIGVIRSDGTALRPLTGLSATSPFIADDGRLYFLAGQIAPTVRDQSVPVVNAAQARIWSMTLDGGDVRQETPQRYDDLRLAGRWPDGRFLIHQGASTSLAFLLPGQQPFTTVPGVIDRVVFSPDRRTAIGLGADRIFRYDLARPEEPVLLLGDLTQPDAWYPQSVALARSSPSPVVTGPQARLAFALHGLIWVTDASGAAHLIRRLQTDAGSLRRLGAVAVPQWSPRGDRVLYFDVLANTAAGAVFVSDTTGAGGRVSAQDATGPLPAWSPDGNVAYIDLIGTRDSAGLGAAGEARIVSPADSSRVATYPGREIAFAGGKTYLIDNGLPADALRTRVEHSIIEPTAGGSRVVTIASILAAGAAYRGQPADPTSALQLSQLAGSADGAFLSVRISPAGGARVSAPLDFSVALLRARDGLPTVRLPGQDIADLRWSPTGHLVGMTAGGAPRVRDAETGAIVASAPDGRFAGWSPDGAWFYVARDAGLYAVSLSGERVRISALGVPVSATP